MAEPDSNERNTTFFLKVDHTEGSHRDQLGGESKERGQAGHCQSHEHRVTASDGAQPLPDVHTVDRGPNSDPPTHPGRVRREGGVPALAPAAEPTA